MTTRTYQGISPQLGNNTYVDPTALVLGDVEIGDDSSVWPMTVIRGDVNQVRIGSRTNIQDGSVLHVTHPGDHTKGYGLYIGNDVTAGHKVILHGCTISDRVLIGMGSTIMDGAVIESDVVIGAGSLVAPGKVLESGYLYLGSPAKRLRPLTDSERAFFNYSARHYMKLKDIHLINQMHETG
ncbi:MAG: gamma carbonic anhydrase family protein [Pseudomonadales bacterium]|jgi:carbonic anhydrase/acetyltransferase-like protein (isoleucine patch superfamily)